MPPLILQHVGPATRQASRLLGISQVAGEVFAAHQDKFFIIAMRGRSLVGCTAGGLLADRSGAFFLPPTDNCSETSVLASLLDEVLAWFEDRRISRIQTITSARPGLLMERGFQRQTSVITLMAETRRNMAPVTPAQLCPIACEVTEDLTRLLERTYAGALDVPEHSSFARADLQEHLKNSRSGVWWTVHNGEDPVGLLLMGDAEQHQRSLLYFGLVPAARGKGHGRRALSWALRSLRDNSIRTVLTQVDGRNESALRCYAASGFFELSRAELFIRRV